MAEKIYLDSTRVHIYPCANRGAGIDIESKLTTESNLINLPARLDPVSSTGLDFINHKLIFIIGGYYIEADLTGETDLQSNCWADYKLAIANLTMSKTGTETYVTKSNMLSNYETGSFELDTNDGKFKGIAFSTDTFGTDTCVQLLKDGELVEQGLFGNITRKGGIAGDAAVPDTGDYLVFLDSSNNNKITKLSPKLDKSQVKMFLSQDGTFRKATLDKFEVALNSSADVHFEDRGEVITGPLNLSLGESRILQCINNTENELKFSTTGGVATLISEVDDKTHNILAVLNAEQEGSISAIRKVYIKTTVTLLTDKFAGLTYYSDKACTTPITSPINIEGYAGEKTKTVYIKSDKFTTIPKSEITVGSIGCKIAKVSGTTGIFSCKFSLLETTTTACTLNIFYDNYDIDFVAANTNGVKWYSDSALTKELITLSVARDSMKSSAYNYSDAYCKVDGSSKPEDITVTPKNSVSKVDPITTTVDYKQYKLTIGGPGNIGNGSVTATADKRYKVTFVHNITTAFSSGAFWSTDESGTQVITDNYYNLKPNESKTIYLHIPNSPASGYTHTITTASSPAGAASSICQELTSSSYVKYRVGITAESSISSAATLTIKVNFVEIPKIINISASVYPLGTADTPTLSKTSGQAGENVTVIAKYPSDRNAWKFAKWERAVDGTYNYNYSKVSPLEDTIPSAATSTLHYVADYKVSIEAKVQSSAMGTVEITGSDVEYKTSGDKTSGWVWSKNGTRSNPIVYTATAKTGYNFVEWVQTSTSMPWSSEESFSIATSENIDSPLSYTAKFERDPASQHTVTLEETNRYFWSADSSSTRLEEFDVYPDEEKEIYAIAKGTTAENIKFTCEPAGSASIEVIGGVDDVAEIKISNVTANCSIRAYDLGNTEIELTTSTNAGYKWVCYDEPTINLYHLYIAKSEETWVKIAKDTATDLNHAGITASEGLPEIVLAPQGNYINVNIMASGETISPGSIDLWSGKIITFKPNENYKWYAGAEELDKVVVKPNTTEVTYIAKIKNSSGTCNNITVVKNPSDAALVNVQPGDTAATVRFSRVSDDCTVTPYSEYTVTLTENNRYYFTASASSTKSITSTKVKFSGTTTVYAVAKNGNCSGINAIFDSSQITVATETVSTGVAKFLIMGTSITKDCTASAKNSDDYKIALNVDSSVQGNWVWRDSSNTKEIDHVYVAKGAESAERVYVHATTGNLKYLDIDQNPSNRVNVNYSPTTSTDVQVSLQNATDLTSLTARISTEYTVTLEENNRYYWTDSSGNRLLNIKLRKADTAKIYAVSKTGACDYLVIDSASVKTEFETEGGEESVEVTLSNCTGNCTLKAHDEDDILITLKADDNYYKWVCSDNTSYTIKHIYWSSEMNATAYIVKDSTSLDVSNAYIENSSGSVTFTREQINDYLKVTITRASDADENILSIGKGYIVTFSENNRYYFSLNTVGTIKCTQLVIKHGGSASLFVKSQTGTACSNVQAVVTGGSSKATAAATKSVKDFAAVSVTKVYSSCVIYACNEDDYIVTLLTSGSGLRWIHDSPENNRIFVSSSGSEVVYIESEDAAVEDVEITSSKCSATKGAILDNLRKITISNPTDNMSSVTASV